MSSEAPYAIPIRTEESGGRVDAIGKAVRRLEIQQSNLMWAVVTSCLLSLAAVVMLGIWEVRYQVVKARLQTVGNEIQQMLD